MFKMLKKKHIWNLGLFLIILFIILFSGCKQIDPYVYCEKDDECILTDIQKFKCCDSCSLEAINKEAELQRENWRVLGCKYAMREEEADKWECEGRCFFPKSAYVAVCKDNACHEEIRLFVTTDKTEYKQGEIVKVSVENRLNEPVLISSCAPVILEYKEDSEWIGHRPLCIDSYIAHQIEPGEKVVIEEFDTGYEYGGQKLYKKGTYRANLEYNLEGGRGMEMINSEEFEIK